MEELKIYENNGHFFVKEDDIYGELNCRFCALHMNPVIPKCMEWGYGCITKRFHFKEITSRIKIIDGYTYLKADLAEGYNAERLIHVNTIG